MIQNSIKPIPLIDTAYLATAYQKTSSCLRNFDEETWLAKIQLLFLLYFYFESEIFCNFAMLNKL